MTTTRTPRASSSSVKTRPSSGWAPSTLQKLAVTLRAGSSSGSPSPESAASPGWLAAISVKTVLWRRHSSHSGGVEKNFDEPVRAQSSSQIMTRRSGVGIGQRTNQHGIDGAEHRGVDADAERQRGDGDGGERRIAADLAQSVADIARELLPDAASPTRRERPLSRGSRCRRPAARRTARTPPLRGPGGSGSRVRGRAPFARATVMRRP